MMQFTDAAPLAGMRITADGYLAGHALCARAGCQTYAGAEVGRPDAATVTVYRPDAEVFDRASMASFAGKPITVGHPAEAVTADNWAELAVGTMGEEVARDGEAIRVSLALMDAAAIKAVQGGKRELSVGYTAALVWGDGVAPDGTPYQAMQTKISVNHLAVVDRGRAGPEYRIGDGAAPWGVAPITQEDRGMPDNLRTVMVDGLSVSVTDQGAQAIEKLTTDRADARKALADAVTAHAAEIAKRDAAIDDLKGKVLDAAALDALVASRGDLVAKASAIAPDIKVTGLGDAEIRRAVVIAKLGDAAALNRPDAYVEARFDILADDAKPGDPVRDALRGGVKSINGGDAVWGDAAFKAAGVRMRKEG